MPDPNWYEGKLQDAIRTALGLLAESGPRNKQIQPILDGLLDLLKAYNEWIKAPTNEEIVSLRKELSAVKAEVEFLKAKAQYRTVGAIGKSTFGSPA